MSGNAAEPSWDARRDAITMLIEQTEARRDSAYRGIEWQDALAVALITAPVAVGALVVAATSAARVAGATNLLVGLGCACLVLTPFLAALGRFSGFLWRGRRRAALLTVRPSASSHSGYGTPDEVALAELGGLIFKRDELTSALLSSDPLQIAAPRTAAELDELLRWRLARAIQEISIAVELGSQKALFVAYSLVAFLIATTLLAAAAATELIARM